MITPGVVFSPGQLVTADMLNNQIADARINDNTIESSQLKNSIINDFGVTTSYQSVDKVMIYDSVSGQTKGITIQDLFDGSSKQVNATDVNATGNMDVTGTLNVGGAFTTSGDANVGGLVYAERLRVGVAENNLPGFDASNNEIASIIESDPVRETYTDADGNVIPRNIGFHSYKYNLPGVNFGQLILGTHTNEKHYISWANDNDPAFSQSEGLPSIENMRIDRSQPISGQDGGLFFNVAGSPRRGIFQFRGDLWVQGRDQSGFNSVKITNYDADGVQLSYNGSTGFAGISVLDTTGNTQFFRFALGDLVTEFADVALYSPITHLSTNTDNTSLVFDANYFGNSNSPNHSQFAFYHQANASSTEDVFQLYRSAQRPGSESVFKVGAMTSSQNIRTEFFDRIRLARFTDTDVTSLTGHVGDLIYNNTQNRLQYYNGSAWTLV